MVLDVGDHQRIAGFSDLTQESKFRDIPNRDRRSASSGGDMEGPVLVVTDFEISDTHRHPAAPTGFNCGAVNNVGDAGLYRRTSRCGLGRLLVPFRFAYRLKEIG